jgi:hypothetical protein
VSSTHIIPNPYNKIPGFSMGDEMHVPHAEAGDLVVRVGDDARPFGEHAHVQAVHVVGALGLVRHALLARHVLHALADQALGLGMERERHAQRPARALAGVVVGRGADAAAREHRLAGLEGPAQAGREALRRIAHIFGPAQLQAAGGQQFDELGHVLVGTLAGEDLVADDDEAEFVAAGHVLLFLGRSSPASRLKPSHCWDQKPRP